MTKSYFGHGSISIDRQAPFLSAAFACCLLAGCVAAPGTMGDLKAAREACNRDYPARLGNYLPHARCVNAAIETYALATAPHPDLIRLQAEIRASLSEKIDRRRLSVQAGERRMAEADRLVAAAQHDREAGNEKAASRRIAAIEQMLK